MHELWLLRHAEAAPAHFGDADADRALTPHGEQQARAVGHWLVEQGRVPDHVICSDARRARDTASLALAALPSPPTITWQGTILGATPGDLLALLDEHGQGECVLLIGHNPGLQYLLTTLCPGLPPNQGMSPATLACIELDGPAEPGRGRLVTLRTA
ncbi:MAG TPA: histidine phosphatase family protein [Oleiagrimonas sp.]|nr:histidine phosphatase family protein [Oleiagrimonas sp.]